MRASGTSEAEDLLLLRLELLLRDDALLLQLGELLQLGRVIGSGGGRQRRRRLLVVALLILGRVLVLLSPCDASGHGARRAGYHCSPCSDPDQAGAAPSHHHLVLLS